MLTPQWPAPANVRAACSTRAGGVSQAPFDQLNLGDHVHDDPEAVAINRQRFAQSLNAHPVFLQQVHGWEVAELDGTTPDGQLADASVTSLSGVACTVMVADCLPVLFARVDGTQVAAAHAGWRGLLGRDGLGVLEATCGRLRHHERSATLMAWLGPCIGPLAFEVGAEVREAFVQSEAASAACFLPQGHGKYRGDLAGLARLRLAQLGVASIYGNDSTPEWCTVSNPSRFFSHRRDHGISGRFAASVWRV